MPRTNPNNLALDVDLQSGVVPISKAASALAALIKRGKERQQPIIVTQKGYPTGVLLPIDLYSTLRDLAQREVETSPGAAGNTPLPPPVSEITEALAGEDEEGESADEPAQSDSSAARRGRGGRRTKAGQ